VLRAFRRVSASETFPPRLRTGGAVPSPANSSLHGRPSIGGRNPSAPSRRKVSGETTAIRHHVMPTGFWALKEGCAAATVGATMSANATRWRAMKLIAGSHWTRIIQLCAVACQPPNEGCSVVQFLGVGSGYSPNWGLSQSFEGRGASTIRLLAPLSVRSLSRIAHIQRIDCGPLALLPPLLVDSRHPTFLQSPTINSDEGRHAQ
jgi:hypothetical protein